MLLLRAEGNSKLFISVSECCKWQCSEEPVCMIATAVTEGSIPASLRAEVVSFIRPHFLFYELKIRHYLSLVALSHLTLNP